MHVAPPVGRQDLFANVAGWASKWHASTITNPTPAGRKAVQAIITANNQEVITGPIQAYNARVLARIRQANAGTAYAFGLAVRVAGTQSAKEAMVFRLQSVNLNMMRLSASGTINSQVSNGQRANTPGTWYWFDLLMLGNRYLLQVWEAGSERPDGWLISSTAGTLMGTQIGVYSANASATIQCDKFVVMPLP